MPPDDGARVVFLGTGGAINTDRYQASVLVEAGGERVLLDLGGGLGVVRCLLAAGIQPASIGHVFISHRHLDHAGGLEPFLLGVGLPARAAGTPPAPMRLYGTRPTLAAVRATLEAADATGPLLFQGRLEWVALADGERAPLGAAGYLELVEVEHLPPDGGAAGCVVEAGGVRVVYSGDTGPCAGLARAARGADLLVHECGGMDERADEVHRPCHSTAGDVGRLAAASGARAVALTHLPPQSYATTDAMLAEARAAAGPAVRVFAAEDGMVVGVRATASAG